MLSDRADAATDTERTILSLENEALERRLDGVFADHFRTPRRCRLRVRANHLLKRVFDAAFLVVGVLAAGPLILLGGLATLLDTGRPIFYVQKRRVRFGRKVPIYKMRTLVVGSDRQLDALVSVKHHGKFLNVSKDCSRYTRAGRWLERLWIVELPQLLNIARGHMCVVGNRPIPDYVINALGPTAEVIERFASPQGLTGYVQCIGRDDVTDEERILLEYHYSDVFERGDVFLEDLKIIALTVAAYFGKRISVGHFLGEGYRERYATFFASPNGGDGPLKAESRKSKVETAADETVAGETNPATMARSTEKSGVNGARVNGWAKRDVGARLSKWQHQAKVALGARTKDQAFTGPLYVQIGVVNACNYRCTFCWDQPSFVPKDAPYTDKISEEYYTRHPEIDRNKAHMEYGMFTDLVDDLSQMGTRKIKFIGRGESFLHKRFMDMLAYVKERGFTVSVTTNGSLIRDEDARRLVELGVDEMYVSVNAGTAATYSEIHVNTPADMFERIKRTLRLITEAKRARGSVYPRLHLSFVIQNNNYHEMEAMVQTAHDVGAEKAHFIGISTYEGTKFLALTDAQKAEMPACLDRAVRLAEGYGIETNAAYFLSRARIYKGTKDVYAEVPCYIGWFFSIILADGTVNPCCECLRALGTLKLERFRDIWFGEAYRKFRAENTNLPFSTKEIPGCRCHDCGFSLHNLAMHRVLHPVAGRRITQSAYGFEDLRRFV